MLTLLYEQNLAEAGWYRTDKGRLCRTRNRIRQTVFSNEPGKWLVCNVRDDDKPSYCGPYKSESKAVTMADIVVRPR